MKKSLMTSFFLLVFAFAHAQENISVQEDNSVKYVETITAEDLSSYLSVLASDSLEGRATAERGQKMAADYIKNKFKEFGLRAVSDKNTGEGYYQEFELEKKSWKDVYVQRKKVKKNNLDDIIYFGNVAVDEAVKTELVFVGGGKEEDYANKKVEGKAVAFLSDPISAEKKIKRAYEKGATAIILIYGNDSQELRSVIDKYSHYITQSSLGFPAQAKKPGRVLFYATPDAAAELLKTKVEKIVNAVEEEDDKKRAKAIKKIKNKKIEYKAEREVETVKTENVLGLVEGSDKKNEIIVITAHYDHIGMEDGEIYNGADDDGSGTSAVIELAEAFAKAKEEGNGPRRSVLFMTVSGEEKGLLGSQFYVENPVYPLEDVVANLNIDMIGRLDDAHEGNPDYIYLIGSDKLSSDLHQLSERVNATFSKLELDYTYNDENDPNRYYYRSDHYNFAKNGIPVIFYFNGVHEDYHKPTDTIEKIDFRKIEKISKLIFHTAWEIANREERIKVDKK